MFAIVFPELLCKSGLVYAVVLYLSCWCVIKCTALVDNEAYALKKRRKNALDYSPQFTAQLNIIYSVTFVCNFSVPIEYLCVGIRE